MIYFFNFSSIFIKLKFWIANPNFPITTVKVVTSCVKRDELMIWCHMLSSFVKMSTKLAHKSSLIGESADNSDADCPGRAG